MNILRLATACLMVFVVPGAQAAKIESLEVRKDGRSYSADAEFVINAPYDVVLDAFTSFDRLAQLNSAVVSSEFEALADGDLRVSTRVKDCVAIFCRTVSMVEDINITDDSQVTAAIVPELSDFADGQTVWEFSDLGSKTRVRYRSELTPKFWIPSFIGKRAIRKTLKRQIRATSTNLEMQELEL